MSRDSMGRVIVSGVIGKGIMLPGVTDCGVNCMKIESAMNQVGKNLDAKVRVLGVWFDKF